MGVSRGVAEFENRWSAANGIVQLGPGPVFWGESRSVKGNLKFHPDHPVANLWTDSSSLWNMGPDTSWTIQIGRCHFSNCWGFVSISHFSAQLGRLWSWDRKVQNPPKMKHLTIPGSYQLGHIPHAPNHTLLIDLIVRNIMPQYIPLSIERWILLGYIVTLVQGGSIRITPGIMQMLTDGWLSTYQGIVGQV